MSLYVSNFQKPLTEKISGGLEGLLSDPSAAAVGCAKTVPGKIAPASLTINKGTAGEEVFEEARSVMFKTLRVRRVYDADSNTVVYTSFSTRLDKKSDTNKSRFKSAICAVNLDY